LKIGEIKLEKSTHKVEVVPVTLTKHSNADRLSIIPVFGYTYVGNSADWAGVSKAAWIPPDSLVDTTRVEFLPLANDAKYYADSSRDVKLDKGYPTYARIRAKKIRGVVSYGFLVPVSDNTPLGADLASELGVVHFEPPIQANRKTGFAAGGDVAPGPNVYHVKYDVDSFQRYASQLFVPGEQVFVSEKLHGANGRWVFHNGQFYAGSRTEWKKEFSTIPVPSKTDIVAQLIAKGLSEAEAGDRADNIIENINKKNSHPVQNPWWKGLRAYSAMMDWLREHPDIVVYGELYGQVQNLKYGTKDGELRIGVFDILISSLGTWMDPLAARLAAPNLPWVPTIHENFPYDFDQLVQMAEGESLVPGANHNREGIVVSPLVEREDSRLGRVKLKIVSNWYLNQD
jgi:RNA ligase (TIGR02306 family)